MKHSRAVIVTASGKRGFLETFGINVSEENESSTGTNGKSRPPGLAASPL